MLFMEAIFVFFKFGRLRPPSCALGTSFYTVSEGHDLMTYVSDNYTSYSAPSPLNETVPLRNIFVSNPPSLDYQTRKDLLSFDILGKERLVSRVEIFLMLLINGKLVPQN